MSYGELYIGPVRTFRNKQNGRFLKGHVPFNKGKKWSEYLKKRSQKRCAKGWKNLDLHRNKNGRADTAGRCSKQVIAVMDDGRWCCLPSIRAAAEWLKYVIGIWGNNENIGRCCRANESKRVKKNDWAPGQPKGSSRVNTDHRYHGIRFYFESDSVWMEKIKKNG